LCVGPGLSRCVHLYSGKVTLAAMYLRRVRVAGCSFEAALSHLSTVVTPPAPVAQDLGVGLRRPCRRQTISRKRSTRQMQNGIK